MLTFYFFIKLITQNNDLKNRAHNDNDIKQELSGSEEISYLPIPSVHRKLIHNLYK